MTLPESDVKTKALETRVSALEKAWQMSGQTLTIQVGTSKIEIMPNSITLRSTGKIEINSTGEVVQQAGGNMTIKAGGSSLTIKAGAAMLVQASTSLTLRGSTKNQVL
jgi:uncharacterized protein (DUF2345 family)